MTFERHTLQLYQEDAVDSNKVDKNKKFTIKLSDGVVQLTVDDDHKLNIDCKTVLDGDKTMIKNE